MTSRVSRQTLDKLTDVPMPRLDAEPGAEAWLSCGADTIPHHRAACVVIGSGAAGLRAAVEMKRRGVDVVITSQSAWGGTSACSGSDKQTLHTANTADQGDDYVEMALALGAGGSMDSDTAYVEATGSGRAMASLQYLGLPLPQDRLGGILRYQTDHDEVGRATSCGPRTSRLMVKVLAEEALRLKIPFFNKTTAIKLITVEDTHGRRIAGVLTIRPQARCDTNPLGFVVYQCANVVLATGGPGELYRDSVYPNGCFGSLGLALEAGITLINLTENQFGIGTRREGFPWNLSGTYVQAIPYIYSVDALGQERNFLADYYRTTQELASNIFRKGYQWPFHATRMTDFGSSLVDLAIHRETGAGHRVYMDFNRNPMPAGDGVPFSLSRLDADVARYLHNAGAVQALPIDRLRHMNPLAIALYRRYKVDITSDPLEFAVNHQHMNGGIAVDVWGRSSLAGCYAIGEAAGTHGVTRPGGAALNAGQVFGTRAAEHIAAGSGVSQRTPIAAQVESAIEDVKSLLRNNSTLTAEAIRQDVQSRMSEKAGIICNLTDVTLAYGDAQRLNAQIRSKGIVPGKPAQIMRALQRQQMALVSEAVLGALHYFLSNGGGSRGARAVCDPTGESVPQTALGLLEDYRFRNEQKKDKGHQITVRMVDGNLQFATRPNRSFDPSAKPFFERDWADWLNGTIFDKATQ